VKWKHEFWFLFFGFGGFFVAFVWLLCGFCVAFVASQKLDTIKSRQSRRTMPSTMTQYTNTTFLPALVKNPNKVLDDICDAIYSEQENSSATMIQMLLEIGAFPVIAGLLDSTDNRLVNNVLLVLGNSLGADDLRLPQCTNKSLIPHQDRVFEHLQNMKTRKNAAYLLYNWVRLFTNPSVDDRFLELVESDFIASCIGACRKDLLYALDYVLRRTEAGRKTVLALLKLVSATVDADNLKILLGALASASEEYIRFKEGDFSYMYGILDRLFDWDQEAKIYRSALFVLSNLVVDAGGADAFLDDSLLLGKMLDFLRAGNDGPLRSEAVWVLANAIQKAECHDYFLANHVGLYEALHDPSLDAISSKAQVALKEATGILEDLRTQYVYPKNESPILVEYDDDDDATTYTGMPPLEEATKEEYVPSAFEFVASQEGYLPSAFELVSPGAVFLSQTVRRLITSLREQGVYSYVPVSDDIIFTGGDLRVIERLGFYLCNGYFSVHPYLRSMAS
jgi:hypothetical protein